MLWLYFLSELFIIISLVNSDKNCLTRFNLENIFYVKYFIVVFIFI